MHMNAHQAGQRNKSKKKTSHQLYKFYWTHGLCSHASSECWTPVEVYQNDATLLSCMGGSDKNISWKSGLENNANSLVNKLTDDTHPTTVTLPNKLNLTTTIIGTLHLPQALCWLAAKAYVLPRINNYSLMFMCIIAIDLWHITLKNSKETYVDKLTRLIATAIIRKDKPNSELADY